MGQIKLSQNQLIKISDILCDNIDLVFDKLNIRLYQSGNSYSGKCPVHCGNNNHAIHIYPDGHTHRGYWRCVTRGCHNTFKPTIIGFIRGVLSNQNYNWNKPTDKFESFENTLKFISETLKVDLNNIEISHEELEKKRFLAQTRWEVPMQKDKPLIKRQTIQSRLSLPPHYFINRGFSAETLKKYDVGYCDNPKKEMYQRCIVLVYDESYNYLVGCLGRSIFDACEKCGDYHNPKDGCINFPKWKNSKYFNKKNSLYNYWFAKEYIKKSKTAILVESCANVWKLEECGIHNAIALYGSELSDSQEFLIEKLGCMRLITIMDNDDAGKQASKRIYDKCSDFYNVKNIEISKYNDIADMTKEEVNKQICLNLD